VTNLVIIEQPSFMQYDNNQGIKLLPYNAPIPLYEKICTTRNPWSTAHGPPT